MSTAPYNAIAAAPSAFAGAFGADVSVDAIGATTINVKPPDVTSAASIQQWALGTWTGIAMAAKSWNKDPDATQAWGRMRALPAASLRPQAMIAALVEAGPLPRTPGAGAFLAALKGIAAAAQARGQGAPIAAVQGAMAARLAQVAAQAAKSRAAQLASTGAPASIVKAAQAVATQYTSKAAEAVKSVAAIPGQVSANVADTYKTVTKTVTDAAVRSIDDVTDKLAVAGPQVAESWAQGMTGIGNTAIMVGAGGLVLVLALAGAYAAGPGKGRR